MSKTVFHILDAISQDVEDGQETETTREIIPRHSGDLTDEDDEVKPARGSRRGAGGAAAQPDARSDPSKMRMNIYLFGTTAEGKAVRACVEGFRPFFFVRLPAATEKAKADFKARIADALYTQKRWLRKVVKLRFEMRKVLYGYTGDKRYCFARISVPSLTAFRALKRVFVDPETSKPIFELYAGEDALEVYEANLDPMLRFFHLRNIKPCGWVETDAEIDEGVIQVDWEEIGPCEKPPMAAAPFLMAAWDIECYSENGEFPLAKKGYDRLAKQIFAAATTPLDAAMMILGAAETPEDPPAGIDGLRHRDGAKKLDHAKLRTVVHSEVFQQTVEEVLAKKEGLAVAARDERVTRLRGLLAGTLKTVLPLAGDPAIQIGVVLVRAGSPHEKHIFVLDTSDEVPGATVHAYRTEKEMIIGWAEAMEAWNPDILMGYNTFGFDERYLWDRATELRITEHPSIQAMSRLVDMDKKMTLEEKFLSSSALGDNTMWIWSTFGRLQIDLFHYVKRSFSLPAYKLDYVCQHFMSGKLAGVDTEASAADAGGTWTLKTKTTGDVIAGRYVVLLDETGDTVVDKLRIVGVEAGKGLVVEAPQGDDAADLAAASADAVKWAMVKDDVSPQDIFTLHKGGGAAGRAKVAAYCVQDCDLTVELYKKLDVFNNAMAMANACSVPVSYIFTRGQGIKIESLIFKECYEREQCVVVLPTQPRPPMGAGGKPVAVDGEEAVAEESYEGAIVLTPNPGFYSESPVGVADFASLYPSTIISENISHDTLVWAKDYDMTGRFMGFSYGSEEGEVLGTGGKAVAWTDIDFDIWGVKEGDTRKNPEKEKKGLRVCRYAQFEGSAKGTLPDIVQKLLAARKAKRKEAEKESDPFKKALLDAEQLAYKLTANSLYGQLGSSTFKIRLQHLAASVTAYGRKQIMFAKAAIERFYGPAAGRKDCTAEAAQVVYGDSVTGDTPLYLKRGDTNVPELCRIDELASTLGSWGAWHETKEAIEIPDGSLTIWTERGWTKVRRLIRHRLAPGKRMFRILTHTGVVDCTEDHSLVAADGTECKPTDMKIGTTLMHNFAVADEFGNGVGDYPSAKEAWAMGFFLADGSADVYDCPSGMKATWAVNKADTTLLKEVAACLPFETKILDTLKSSGVYKLVPVGAIKEQAVRYRELFYNGAREKRVPPCILNAPLEIVEKFMAGFYAGDGDKANGFGYKRWDKKGKEVGTGLYILGRRMGYNVSLNDRADKRDIFRMTLTDKAQRKNPIAIKKIRELDTEGLEYVYDLETENHHFAVGPGALVVHNTDSLFVCFNPKNPETGERLQGRDAILATMRLTEEAGKMVTTCLKPPHDFEYDKTMFPFIIFSKKRYVGNLYEESPDSYYQNGMGIATKRRDYAGIVKVIYGGAIRILLTQKDPVAAAEFVRGKLMDLAEGRASMNQLTMSKSLRSEYKAATPPAHKILAQRIAARDPGNAPASGDRISFLYVLPPVGQQASKNQGDRIETPAWIKEKKLEVDAKFYMEHQLMNPISQLFSLVVEQLPGCKAPGGRSWAVADAADREYAAVEYLFRDALNTCDRAAQRRLVAKMFGGAATTAPPPIRAGRRGGAGAAAAAGAPTTPTVTKQVQASITSLFAQKMLIKAAEKAAVATPRPRPTTPESSSASSVGEAKPATPAPAKKPRKATGKKAAGAAAAAAGKTLEV